MKKFKKILVSFGFSGMGIVSTATIVPMTINDENNNIPEMNKRWESIRFDVNKLKIILDKFKSESNDFQENIVNILENSLNENEEVNPNLIPDNINDNELIYLRALNIQRGFQKDQRDIIHNFNAQHPENKNAMMGGAGTTCTSKIGNLYIPQVKWWLNSQYESEMQDWDEKYRRWLHEGTLYNNHIYHLYNTPQRPYTSSYFVKNSGGTAWHNDKQGEYWEDTGVVGSPLFPWLPPLGEKISMNTCGAYDYYLSAYAYDGNDHSQNEKYLVGWINKNFNTVKAKLETKSKFLLTNDEHSLRNKNQGDYLNSIQNLKLKEAIEYIINEKDLNKKESDVLNILDDIDVMLDMNNILQDSVLKVISVISNAKGHNSDWMSQIKKQNENLAHERTRLKEYKDTLNLVLDDLSISVEVLKNKAELELDYNIANKLNEFYEKINDLNAEKVKASSGFQQLINNINNSAESIIDVIYPPLELFYKGLLKKESGISDDKQIELKGGFEKVYNDLENKTKLLENIHYWYELFKKVKENKDDGAELEKIIKNTIEGLTIIVNVLNGKEYFSKLFEIDYTSMFKFGLMIIKISKQLGIKILDKISDEQLDEMEKFMNEGDLFRATFNEIVSTAKKLLPEIPNFFNGTFQENLAKLLFNAEKNLKWLAAIAKTANNFANATINGIKTATESLEHGAQESGKIFTYFGKLISKYLGPETSIAKLTNFAKLTGKVMGAAATALNIYSLISAAYNFINADNPHDTFDSLYDLLSTGLAMSPEPFSKIAGLVMVGIKTILSLIKTANGFSAWDNIFDRGLNDYKFILKNNLKWFADQLKTYSNDFSQAIVIQVQDPWYYSPEISINGNTICSHGSCNDYRY